jgi:drug/metabolite transporter (DMT)-like permease
MHLNNTIKGAILVILSAFFFALEYLLFDAVFQVVDISPQSALFWSLLTTVLVVAPFFVFDKKQRQKLATTIRRDTKTVLAVSVVSTIGFYLVVWAVAQSNSGITSLLHETKLIFIPLMGVFLLHEQLNRIQLAGISIAICGFVFISSLRGEVSLVVVLALLLSALLYSLQSFFLRSMHPDSAAARSRSCVPFL